MPCFYPYTTKDGVPVPCGKCPACLKRRTDSWCFRLEQELKVRSGAVFVTLTYDTQHVPLSESGFMTLSKRDFQLFMKRLRKLHYERYGKNHKLSYYACGEYGGRTQRPHFHAIIFDCHSPSISSAWTVGNIHVGGVSGASVAYTCKYINKGRTVPAHRCDDRLPEFSLMSRGLGKCYLSPAVIKYHHEDLSRNFVTRPGDIKLAMPRYYRERIFSKEQRDLQMDIIHTEVHAASEAEYQKFVKRTGGTVADFVRLRNESRRAIARSFKVSRKENL